MSLGLIANLVLKGASIFQEERARHFEKKAQDLLDNINEVSDSDFYSKDMEKKGKAERAIYQKEMELYSEFMQEKKR